MRSQWHFSNTLLNATAFTCFVNTVEPGYNEVLGTMKIILLHIITYISGFSLYQGKKTKKCKELGPTKVIVIRGFGIYPTSL